MISYGNWMVKHAVAIRKFLVLECEYTPSIVSRYDFKELQEELKLCGGNKCPAFQKYNTMNGNY